MLNLQTGDFKVWQDLRLELLHIVLTHVVADYKNDECFFVRTNHVQMMMMSAKNIKMMAVQPCLKNIPLHGYPDKSLNMCLKWLASQFEMKITWQKQVY